MNQKKKSKTGCWVPIVIFLGAVLIWMSPLNPLMEFKYIGEEEYMTNSTWLLTIVFLGALIWFLVEKFKDKE